MVIQNPAPVSEGLSAASRRSTPRRHGPQPRAHQTKKKTLGLLGAILATVEPLLVDKLLADRPAFVPVLLLDWAARRPNFQYFIKQCPVLECACTRKRDYTRAEISAWSKLATKAKALATTFVVEPPTRHVNEGAAKQVAEREWVKLAMQNQRCVLQRADCQRVKASAVQRKVVAAEKRGTRHGLDAMKKCVQGQCSEVCPTHNRVWPCACHEHTFTPVSMVRHESEEGGSDDEDFDFD